MSVTILQGDCRDMLKALPAESIQCCVTSPPYFGLRDYGTGAWEGGDEDCDHRKVADAVAAISGSTLGGGKKTTGHVQEGFKTSCGRCGAVREDSQIGLEQDLDGYVEQIVSVFRDVRRVLRDDGTVWLNLGDSFSSGGRGSYDPALVSASSGIRNAASTVGRSRPAMPSGVKPKDLLGVPWMAAFALRLDGWYLRSDIVWAKPNPMPESVMDRPTRAHEYIFLLSKAERYFYDAAAIRDPIKESSLARISQPNFDSQTGGEKDYANGTNASRSMRKTVQNFADKQRGHRRRHDGFNDRWDHMTKEEQQAMGANKRDVWNVATHPYADAHFAVFPEALIEPCILAGSRVGDTVLDPFAGSGTTLRVATKHRRNAIGIELNPAYCDLIEKRTSRVQQTLPMEDASCPP